MTAYPPLQPSHIRELTSITSADRVSSGSSVLNLHSRDMSHHPACRPEVVIWPINAREVADILRLADRDRIPVVGWGSGSSLEGNPIPVKKGIILDFSQMNRILDIRTEDFQVDVEPGVVYQDLNQRLKDTGLFFPPDPGARATLGGMIANNASGTRTVYYGSTKNYVLRLEVVLAGGEIIEMGSRVAKSSSGYNLLNLFVGSEGTLGIVTRATLRLTGLPEVFSAAVVTFPSVGAAASAVFDIKRYGLNPAALELLGSECVELLNRRKNLELEVSPTLFIEYHGPSLTYLSEIIEMTASICKDNGCREFRSGLGTEERNRIFEARHELGEIIKTEHTDCDIQTVDVAVPITTFVDILDETYARIRAAGITGYAFSHAGDGNLHINLAGRKGNAGDWELIDDISSSLVSSAIAAGGTATGEHGVGIGKRKFMAQEHGDSMQWMKKIKTLFDPNGILNPGKMFPE